MSASARSGLRRLLSGGDRRSLAQSDAALLPVVLRGLAAFEASGKKSLQTRARHIRTRVQLLG